MAKPSAFKLFAGPLRACAIAAMIALTGCAYKGAKVTEGTDFSAGISLPATEGVAQVSFVNYLSGFRLGVAENSGMECEFRGTNHFSFAWGLYESRADKWFKAKVEPCEVEKLNVEKLNGSQSLKLSSQSEVGM